MQRSGAFRLTLVIVAAAGGLAGLIAPGAAIADGELVTLLRFMAVLKAAMALAAYGLVDWRLRMPARPSTGAAAIAGVALMSAGAGLIWSLAWIALGAVLFHAGLLLLLTLAWRDGSGRVPSRFRRPTRYHGLATGTATSFLRRNGSVQGGS